MSENKVKLIGTIVGAILFFGFSYAVIGTSNNALRLLFGLICFPAIFFTSLLGILGLGFDSLYNFVYIAYGACLGYVFSAHFYNPE